MPPQKGLAVFALWPVACALCLIVAGGVAVGIHPAATIVQPEAVKALFFLLGFAFPVLAFVLARDGVPNIVRQIVAAAGALLVVTYIALSRQAGAVPFALLEVAVAWPLVRAMWRDTDQRGWTVCAIGLAALGGWSVAATLAFTNPLSDLVLGRTPYAPFPAIAIAFVLATLLGALTFTWPAAARWSRSVYAADAIAVVIFAIASWRRDLVFGVDDHHVSFFVGPVEAVRQGHWLLWDVPSQYGFANLWLIGHLPARNGYEAFAYANAAVIFFSAVILYAVARTWARAPWAALFCAATVTAATFFVGGVWFMRLGSEHYPSVGAMRFIWCFVLVGLTAIGYARGYFATAPKAVLAAGSACWLAACWWSAESAIFATVIWFPTAVTLMWVRKLSPGAMARWIASVAGALLASIVLVELGYVAGLGHGPDWLSFFEYGLLYQGGYAATALTTLGGAWLLVSGFAVTVGLAVYCWYAKAREGLPLLVAAAAAQWATMSYFVVRSADNNVDNLVPIQILALFAALAVIEREQIAVAVAGAVRLFAVPITALTCAVVLWSWPFTTQVGYFSRAPGSWAAVARQLSPDVQQFLRQHGLGPASPVLYIGSRIDVLLPPQWPGNSAFPHLWTPGLPPLLIAQLPLDRQVVYVSRFSATEPAGGYTLIDASAPPISPNFLPALLAVYTPTVVGRVGSYVLTRYERRLTPAR